MPDDKISCLPLKQLTDGPLFGAGPGTLSSLTNMELQPGGYAEMRGGMEELKPSGGTAADPISSGGYSDVIQVSSNYGWIRTETPAGVFTGNLQFDSGWEIFGATPAEDASVYFGADLPFSRVTLMKSNLTTIGITGVAYEYWNGAWTALTTAETMVFSGVAITHASWTLTTDWAANTVGDVATGRVYKYWMRIRVTSVAAPTTVTAQWAIGNWVGSKDLYFLTQDPRAGATTGTFKRRDQNSTTAEDFAISTSLFSGNASPARSAAYRGRLYFVNGKEQKRWDGTDYVDIGLPAYAATTTIGAAAAGTGMGAGIWRHYVAWAYGPLQNKDALTVRTDPEALYGVGQATYSGTERTTTAGVEQVTVTITGTIPEDVSAAYIYRTPDLTNVAAANRGDFPAFLVGVLWRYTSGTNPVNVLVNAGVFNDIYAAPLFPQQEAITYSNLPPPRQKYIAVYQNRLFLGDDNYWVWSDPFRPDSFNNSINYVALAKATGGRHMGGIEFGDQVVLFTEDQTWGLTNVDLDVPQLFPIALGVGCVAPDAIAVVDGVLIWPARDGFYAWTGNGAVRKISGKMETAFGKLSFTTHGGSKAAGHNRRYDIRLASPDYATEGSAWRFSLDTGEWATISPAGMTSTIYPLATIYAPLGNNDEGTLHPIWGKANYLTTGDFSLYLGELTTQDAGTNFTFSAYMHFPTAPGELFSPSRVVAYYQAANGWTGSPTFGFVPSDVIGSAVGTLNTGTADTGTDYSVIAGTFSQVGRGTSDLKISFSGTSAAGGTVNGQRLFGAVLEGQRKKIRRGGV